MMNTQNKNLDSNKMKEIEFGNYNDALSKEGEMYLACDLNEKGKKDYAVCSLKRLRPYLDDNHNLYEILKYDKRRYSYIDFDCKHYNIRNYAEGKTDDEIKKEITNSIHSMMEDFLGTYSFNEDAPCHILDASNKVKFSFHFKFDIVLENSEDCEIFHKKFLEHCNTMYSDEDDYHNFHKYIDPNVYTKNRLIRLPNQSKYGQDRPLKIYSGSKNITDHILTYIKKSDKPITIPPPWKKIHTKKYQIVKSIPTKTIDGFQEDEELVWLVNHTLHKRELYEDWIKVVWACIAAGVPIQIIHEADYEACPEKYDEDGTNKIIKQYIDGKGLGKHSLIKWAAEAGYYLDREVEKKAKELSQNREDHITWVDLQKKYHDKIFENFEDMIDLIRDDVSQVVSYVQGAQSVFTMYSNDENPFDLTKCLPRFFLKYKEIEDYVRDGITFQNVNIKTIKLLQLITDNPLKFPLYNKLVFKPMNHGVKKHERNTWSGFKAEERDNYDLEYIQPILNHIKEVLADGDEHNYKYIMSWLHRILTTPWNKTGIFMLFYGEQGTGKTIVADFLMKDVIGKNLSFSTSGIKPLTQRFNGCTMSKIFCCCNELSAINENGNNWHAGFDTMKNLITDRFNFVERKGLEHITIDNHINFMGTTNNPNCIKVERGDRRYACFEVSNKYKGNYEYFDKLIKCMDEIGGNHFYNYLRNYPKEDLVPLRIIPNTSLRTNLISNSLSQFERFINDFLDEEYNMDERKWISKENKEISKKDLYEEYLYWCNNNGETHKPSHILFRNIPKNKLAIDLSKRPRKTINGKRVNYVKFI